MEKEGLVQSMNKLEAKYLSKRLTKVAKKADMRHKHGSET